ncbi:MAG: DUF4111 domain-containing protein [Acetatifactor sp.]|nr:DUF4111 domain-containing protein [Acetatifactor sp.]
MKSKESESVANYVFIKLLSTDLEQIREQMKNPVRQARGKRKDRKAMKHKRLNRDGWGFSYYPYYQMRIDDELFHGLACLIQLTDGEENYWATPKAGRIQVTGAGMCWLELVPDDVSRVITVKYFPEGTHDAERKHYPVPSDQRYQPSIYYVDITEGMEYDEYGIATYIDKYLDVIFTPEGDVKIDDRDELDAAYASGELTKEQYDAALQECESILKEYCEDIAKTGAWCAKIREMVEEKIKAGEPIKPCKEVLELQNSKLYRVTTQFTKQSRTILGDNLTGVYLHGSAVMGCYNPEKSDVDLIVVVNDSLSDDVKRKFMDMIMTLNDEGPAKGIEMSIVRKADCNPYLYPTPFELHFSAMHVGWYRDNPEDYIKKMKGTDADLAAHFTIIQKRGKRLYGAPIDEVFAIVPQADYVDSIWNDIADAEEEITDHPTYLTLNLARVLAYLKDGLVLSKKEGGEWALNNVPDSYHRLIKAALSEYAGAMDLSYDAELAKDYAGYMVGEIARTKGKLI